jgi:hypothetical protein
MTDPTPLVISDQDRVKAEELKGKANEFFSQGLWEEAIEKYTEAISYNPRVAAYYSNRSIGNY